MRGLVLAFVFALAGGSAFAGTCKIKPGLVWIPARVVRVLSGAELRFLISKGTNNGVERRWIVAYVEGERRIADLDCGVVQHVDESESIVSGPPIPDYCATKGHCERVLLAAEASP